MLLLQAGRCLVSVGTNANNLDALENVGLVPLHDYAVIGMHLSSVPVFLLLHHTDEFFYHVDIQEDSKGNRLVTLYNAWNVVEPRSPSPTQWTAQLGNALPQTTPLSRRPERVGTFTISWESLQMYFETVYLNWDPTTFQFQHLVHLSESTFLRKKK